MDEVDPQVFKELERIVKLDALELSEAEVGFLRARAAYLNGEQVKKYEEVLKNEEKTKKEKI